MSLDGFDKQGIATPGQVLWIPGAGSCTSALVPRKN